MEVIKHNSVYVAKKNKNGEMSYKWIPLTDVDIGNGKSLGEYIRVNEEEKQELRKEIKELKEQLIKLTAFINDFRKVTEKSFNYVVDEINKEKFL